MDDRLVTVAIPNYNYGRFVCDAVRSALEQQGVPIEVFVLDNASTDDSVARLHAEFDADPRVTILVNECNIGMEANFGRAMRIGNGRYLLVLNSDDQIHEGHLAHAVSYYENHDEVDILYGGFTCADVDMRNEYYLESPTFLGMESCYNRDELRAVLKWGHHHVFPTVVFRRRTLERFGYLEDPNVVQAYDSVYFVRCALAGARFAFDSAPRARLRKHEAQASTYEGLVGSGRQARDFLTMSQYVLDAEPRRHVARWAATALEYAEKRLAPFAESYAEFVREHGARALQVRSALLEIANGPQRELPLVSVVVTSRGDVARLERALESLSAKPTPTGKSWSRRSTRSRSNRSCGVCRTAIASLPFGVAAAAAPPGPATPAKNAVAAKSSRSSTSAIAGNLSISRH